MKSENMQHSQTGNGTESLEFAPPPPRPPRRLRRRAFLRGV